MDSGQKQNKTVWNFCQFYFCTFLTLSVNKTMTDLLKPEGSIQHLEQPVLKTIQRIDQIFVSKNSVLYFQKNSYNGVFCKFDQV